MCSNGIWGVVFSFLYSSHFVLKYQQKTAFCIILHRARNKDINVMCAIRKSSIVKELSLMACYIGIRAGKYCGCLSCFAVRGEQRMLWRGWERGGNERLPFVLMKLCPITAE